VTCGVGVQLRKNVLYDDRDSSGVTDDSRDSSDVSDADDRDLNSDVVEDCTDQDETQNRHCYQPPCEGTIHFHQKFYFQHTLLALFMTNWVQFKK
jgi:hypothetical protein